MSLINLGIKEFADNIDTRLDKYIVFSEEIAMGNYDAFLEDLIISCRNRVKALSEL